MKINIQIAIGFFSLLFYTNRVNAQSIPLSINLETVLTLAGANNLTIEEYRHRQALATANLTRAKEWWLPELSAGAATHQLWGAVMNGNGRFFLDVERSNLWVGAQASLSWDFSEDIFITNAAKRRAVAMQYFSQAERNKALLQTIEAYYDFLAAQLSVQAWQQLTAQADSIARQVNVQAQAGLRYESEALLAKANLSHLRVETLNSRAEFGKKTAALIRLLNLDPGTELLSVDTLLTPLALANGNFTAASFESAHQLRPELRGMELGLQALQAEKKTTIAGLFLPELRVGAHASQFGGLLENVEPMDPVAFPSTDVLYPTQSVNAALTWRIPLGRLTYAGERKQYDARIVLQQTQIEQMQAQVNGEIIGARAQLLAAKEQMDLAKEGSELADKALRQSMQRQALGTVRPFEVLQAQEVFIKTHLDHVQAVVVHNKAQYRLWVAMGNNL
ncbi:MAG: TolC family protein [Saprospirales bacterium]|nr:TolC family protein [Saprospirales bacterium]